MPCRNSADGAPLRDRQLVEAEARCHEPGLLVMSRARETTALFGRQRQGHAPPAALFAKFLTLSQHRQRAALIVSQVLDAGLRQVSDDYRVGMGVFVHAAQRQFEMRESLLDLVELVSRCLQAACEAGWSARDVHGVFARRARVPRVQASLESK